MSAGVEVIASKVGGIPDAIENGKYGILIYSGDMGNLAIALKILLENDSKRHSSSR